MLRDTWAPDKHFPAVHNPPPELEDPVCVSVLRPLIGRLQLSRIFGKDALSQPQAPPGSHFGTAHGLSRRPTITRAILQKIKGWTFIVSKYQTWNAGKNPRPNPHHKKKLRQTLLTLSQKQSVLFREPFLACHNQRIQIYFNRKTCVRIYCHVYDRRVRTFRPLRLIFFFFFVAVFVKTKLVRIKIPGKSTRKFEKLDGGKNICWFIVQNE